MKYIKHIIAAAVLLIVVLVIVAYAIVSRYDYNSLKPRIETAVMEATGRKLTLAGDITLDFGFTPVLVINDVSFENAGWGSREDLARIKRFEVEVALMPLLGRSIEVKRLILVEPDILVETDKRGRSNLDFDTATKAVKETDKKAGTGTKSQATEPEAKPMAFAFNRVFIEGGTFSYRDMASGSVYNVALDTLEAGAAGLETPVKIKLKGSYNDSPFDVSGTVGSFVSLNSPDKPWSLDITAKAAGAEIALDGAVRDVFAGRGIDLKFKVDAKNLSGLEKLAETTLPFSGPVRFSGRVVDKKAKGSYKITGLKANLAGSDLSGDLDVRLSGKRPFVGASLDSKKLDLRPFMKADGGGGAGGLGAGKKKSKKMFSREKLPLELLRTVDAVVELKAASVLTTTIVLKELRLAANLKNGKFTASRINAKVGGGEVKGKGLFDASKTPARLTAKFNVSGLDTARMLSDLGITDMLSGKLDLDLDVSSKGSTVAALMAGLNGKTDITMGKGRVRNKAIDGFNKDIKNGLIRMLAPSASEKEFTEINCATGWIRIKNGIARTRPVVIDTSLMSVVAEGRIDLRTEKIKVVLRPSPKEAIGSESFSMAVGELATPFKLSGTLMNPRLEIDPAGAAIAIGKTFGGSDFKEAAGILSLLTGGSKGGDEVESGGYGGAENACIAAVKGVKKSGVKKKKTAPKPDIKKQLEQTGDEFKKNFKDIEKSLKGLFGR